MKTKNALAFWYNLKGNYDVVIFDNLKNLKKFKAEYEELYNAFINGELDFDNFQFNAENLYEWYSEHIIKVINELYSKDFEEDKYYTKYIIEYINDEKTKIEIFDKLDYGC